MSNLDQDLHKKYAALAYALGCIRGILFDVLDGDPSPEELRRIYESTATSSIAQSVGMTESDMAVDWNDFLTETEKQGIQGL